MHVIGINGSWNDNRIKFIDISLNFSDTKKVILHIDNDKNSRLYVDISNTNPIYYNPSCYTFNTTQIDINYINKNEKFYFNASINNVNQTREVYISLMLEILKYPFYAKKKRRRREWIF